MLHSGKHASVPTLLECDAAVTFIYLFQNTIKLVSENIGNIRCVLKGQLNKGNKSQTVDFIAFYILHNFFYCMCL